MGSPRSGDGSGSAVDFTYKLPFAFTGKIEKVAVELKMTMKKTSKTRRRATDVAAAGLSSSPAVGEAKRKARTVRTQVPKDAALALARLKTGNRRFVAGKLAPRAMRRRRGAPT